MNLGDVVQDRYKIVRFLGRGGMGTVYLCQDLRLPGKQWALKEMVVHDPVVIEQVKDSFFREARILARLRHRNLPVIVDFFSVHDKQYLVMEYIEGETLARFVDRSHPVDETQVLRWALELSQVLDYLHRQEKPIIFRDLKPDNIIVTADRHVKLVDFGLARHFDPRKGRDTQASGSVGYAPPEQWEDLQQTDERSDIYSFGATLYYVLTKRPPSPIYGSHRIRPHRPGIDPGTEALVLRCLQPEPAQRYANTAELIRDILVLLSDEKHQREIPRPEPRPRPSASPLRSVPQPLLVNRLPAFSWLPVLLMIATFAFVTGAALGWRPPPSDEAGTSSLFRVLAATAGEKREARELIARQDYSAAINLLDSLVTRHAEDAEAHILKANAYAKLSGSYQAVPVITSIQGRDLEGFQLLHGLALAQAEINREGGVRGRQLVLDVYDDQSRVEQALAVAQKIVANPDYVVAIGPFTSQHTIAVAPVFNNAGLPLVAPAASDPRVWAAGRYVYTASDSDTRKVEVLADYFVERGLIRGAIFHDQSSIVSRSYADEFTEHFREQGGELAAAGSYDETTEDFGPLIDEVRASGADFVFLADYRVPPVVRFLTQLRHADLTLPVATQNAAFSETLIMQGKDAVEGLLLSTYFHPDAQEPRIQEFAEQFRQSFGGLTPSHREANAYDSLILVREALETVGFERDQVEAYLSAVGDAQPPFQGVTGKFSPSRRLDLRPPYLVRIRGGGYRLDEKS